MDGADENEKLHDRQWNQYKMDAWLGAGKSSPITPGKGTTKHTFLKSKKLSVFHNRSSENDDGQNTDLKNLMNDSAEKNRILIKKIKINTENPLFLDIH